MQPDSTNNGNSKIIRFLRVFAPFFILLILLAFLNFRISSVDVEPTRQPVAERMAEVTKPASATAPRATPATEQRPAPIATAIPNATASISLTVEPTQTPIASWTSEEVALLTGPPPSSQFSIDVPLSFYWQAGRQLPDDYLYGLYLVGADFNELVAELSEPNLGGVFAVHLAPEDFNLKTGEYFWQVRLMQQPGDITLGESEQRPFRLTGAGN